MRRACVVLILGLAGTQVSAADPLQCPAGTRLERVEARELKTRVEFCVDEKTGQEHGPHHTYDDTGELLSVLAFKDGEQVSRRFTPAGARRMLNDVNGALEMMRMPARYREQDARTLGFEVTADPPEEPLPANTADEVKADLRTDPYVCMLLSLPGGPYELTKVRYLRKDGSAWLQVDIRREECGAPQ